MNFEIETIKKNILPILKWYQTNEYIYITFLVLNSVNNGIELKNENNIIFNVLSNNNLYYIEFELYDNIINNESKIIFNEKNVKFILKKNKNEDWERLTFQKNIYKNNIKIDWDNWINEQSVDEENNDTNNNEEFNFQKMLQNMGGIQNMDNIMGNINTQDFNDNNYEDFDEDNNEDDNNEEDTIQEDNNEYEKNNNINQQEINDEDYAYSEDY
jgi:hypothetical protein